MKKALIFILVITSLFLVSCDFDKAQAYGNDFCTALLENNEVAKEFLHPNSKLNGEKFDEFIARLEKHNEIDFSQGGKTINSSWNSYSYGVVWEGYKYEYAYEMLVGDKTINMFVVIIDDSNGYGVYSFGIIE